ncbi:acyltransferase [Janibacter indicus]
MIFSRLTWLLRGFIFSIWVRACGGHVGKGVLVDKGVSLRSLPHKGIHIGDRTYIGRGVVIDVPRSASLHVGSRVHINHYCVIAAAEKVSIGDDSQIGELCSLRDSDHSYEASTPIRSQGLQSTPVTIGRDVWIGRGTAILRGSAIGPGAIIGANSLTRHTVRANSVNVGVPARFIRSRSNEDAS